MLASVSPLTSLVRALVRNPSCLSSLLSYKNFVMSNPTLWNRGSAPALPVPIPPLMPSQAGTPDLAMPGLIEGQPDASIAYCPERVLPGKIPEALTHHGRSNGGITPRAARKALALHQRFAQR